MIASTCSTIDAASSSPIPIPKLLRNELTTVPRSGRPSPCGDSSASAGGATVLAGEPYRCDRPPALERGLRWRSTGRRRSDVGNEHRRATLVDSAVTAVLLPDVPATAIGRAVLPALSQGVVIHASDGRILLTNPAADRILGVHAGAAGREDPRPLAVAHDPRGRFPLPQRRPSRDHRARHRARGPRRRHGRARPDGTLSWLWVTAVPVEGEPGPDDPAVVATFTDITDQLALRQQLVESEERFRMLAENSADVVLRTGSDGTVDWVSPSILAVLGGEPEEWIGRRAIEFLHPDDRVLVAQQVRAARGQRHARAVAARPGSPLRRGGWRWMGGTGTALRNPDGRVIGGVDSLRDITVEVQAREALRDSEQRFRLLAENSTDVVVRSRDGIITWVSPSLLTTTGWRPHEWVGRPNRDFVHPDDLETQLREFAAAPISGPGMARRRILCQRQRLPLGRVRTTSRSSPPTVRSTASSSSVRLIDDTVTAEQDLDRRARYDELTGLLNRAEIIERLNRILEHPRRARSRDRRRLLRRRRLPLRERGLRPRRRRRGAACPRRAVRTVVREDDLVARFGGDEILVVLPGVRDLDQVVGVAEKLRAQAQLPVPILGGTFPVSASIGVTLAHPGESADSLIARADEAMFAAKAGGENRVVAIGATLPEPGPPPTSTSPTPRTALPERTDTTRWNLGSHATP